MIGDIHSIATVLRVYGRYLIGIKNGTMVVGIQDDQTAWDAEYTIQLRLREFNFLFSDFPRYYIHGREDFKAHFSL
jgi:hypothetical protein